MKKKNLLIMLLTLICLLSSGCYYEESYIEEGIEEVITEPSIDGSDAISSNEDLTLAKLERVVDGDTIWVNLDGESQKVRLIGVDTPESVHADQSKNTEYGDMASDYTKSLLEDMEYVYLQFDKERTDRYDRLLAYVWLSDNVDTESRTDIYNYMLNAILVRDGYAQAKTYKPNVEFESEFAEIQYEAESEQRGVWKYVYWD